MGMRTPVLTSVAMTKLENYMTHDADFSFDIKSFGQPSGTALNASQLEEKFNTDFNTYQNNYRAALCSRLAMAIADLPSPHRDNLLKASHFLQVAFKDDDDNVQPAYQGVVVVGEGNSVQPFTFAYDIFPLTGVIRMLPVIAHSNNSLNKSRAHSTMLSMGRQIPTPHLSVGDKLGLRYPLNVNTYGVEVKKTDKHWQIPLLSARFAFSDLGSGDETSKIQRFSEQVVDKVFAEPVKQLKQVCRQPTPYEKKVAADAATHDLLCRILIPFYSTIQDIKEGTLTVGGVVFGAIELLSFIIPFGLAAHAGASAFMAAGKIGVKFSALGVSNFALQSAKTAVAAKQASKVLASGLADAVNPFNFVGSLFQGGKKVASVVQGNYQALRQQLNTLPSLARLKQLSNASKATTDLVLAQRSLAHYELKGLTVNSLRSQGNNLYSDTLGKNYLEIDNKLYLSSPDTGDGRYIYSPLNYRDKLPIEWIDAKWQPTGRYGRLLGGGPFIGQRYRTANTELAKIVSQAGQKAEDFTPLQTEAFVNGLTNLVKSSNADSYDNIKQYAEAGSRLINSQLRAQQTSTELVNFLNEFKLLNDYTGVAYRSAYVTSNGAMRIREGIGKVFIDRGVQSASSQYINVNSWHQSPWVRNQVGQSATQPAVFIFDSSIAKKNMATSFLADHVAIAPDTSLQVLSTRMVADTLYVYFSAPPHRIDQRYHLFDGKLMGG
ncbi:hypothetical protein REG_1209 [Candidatus Regiella insecticola LSR1]|uniref:Uncharacterized protein n=2 Tax=Candidatus Regiella insecticola TaxID=138073 RepID=E0WT61_9ENTR|nr:hypothetical protein REG_1209 [Candidatus Regiella insecticola LSR1]